MNNDTRTIEDRFFEVERRREEIEDIRREAEDIENESRELEAKITRDEAEAKQLQERILKGSQTIHDNVRAIEEIPKLKQDLERLRGLIAYQDNRSKQFKTIIERGY
jgi:predicted  nucleic acid-binding Zn-ribbon protein